MFCDQWLGGYIYAYEGRRKSKMLDAEKWGDWGSVKERSFAMITFNGEHSKLLTLQQFWVSCRESQW